MRGRGAAALEGHDREVAGPVPEISRIAALHVGDPLPVGAPGGAPLLRGGARHRARNLPGAAAHHEDVGVHRAVGIGQRAVADERDPLAVRRPRGSGIVEGTGGEGEARLLLHVEDAHVRPLALQVADGVPHELQAARHDRPGDLLPVALRLPLVGVRVAHQQRETPPVGRPCEVGDAPEDARELRRLAAPARQEEHLLRFVPLGVARRGEVGDPPAVGAEAGLRGRLRSRGQARRLAARDRGEPDVGLLPVLFRVQPRHRERDRLSVGRDLGIGDRLQGEEVVHGQRAAPRRRRGGPTRTESGRSTRRTRRVKEEGPMVTSKGTAPGSPDPAGAPILRDPATIRKRAVFG